MRSQANARFLLPSPARAQGKTQQNRKLTDFYPVRRSSRKSKAELQVEGRGVSSALAGRGGPAGRARRAGPQLASGRLGASLCLCGLGILLGLVGIIATVKVTTWLAGQDASGKGLRSLERVAGSRGYP